MKLGIFSARTVPRPGDPTVTLVHLPRCRASNLHFRHPFFLAHRANLNILIRSVRKERQRDTNVYHIPSIGQTRIDKSSLYGLTAANCLSTAVDIIQGASHMNDECRATPSAYVQGVAKKNARELQFRARKI